eukprot:COSAG01_NODE_3379_length_6171_cov_17.073287_5_plen_165_part_00
MLSRLLTLKCPCHHRCVSGSSEREAAGWLALGHILFIRATRFNSLSLSAASTSVPTCARLLIDGSSHLPSVTRSLWWQQAAPPLYSLRSCVHAYRTMRSGERSTSSSRALAGDPPLASPTSRSAPRRAVMAPIPSPTRACRNETKHFGSVEPCSLDEGAVSCAR